MSYTPESSEWIEFADAINTVETLPHDDQYSYRYFKKGEFASTLVDHFF